MKDGSIAEFDDHDNTRTTDAGNLAKFDDPNGSDRDPNHNSSESNLAEFHDPDDSDKDPNHNPSESNLAEFHDPDDSDKDPNYNPSESDDSVVDWVVDKESLQEVPLCDNSNKGALEKNNPTSRPKKGRKRKYETQTFRSRKKLKDSNEKHFSVKGNLVIPKKFSDFVCHCSNKCNLKVSRDSREKIFIKFWELGSYDSQTTFIAALVSEVEAKRKRSNSEKRKYTRIYKLGTETVCREMFVNTLSISTKRVNTALCKMRSDTVKDCRGIHKKGTNRIPIEIVEAVKNHINKFPRYKSHYCRKDNDHCEYLPTELTERKMYDLYKEENEGQRTVSFSWYRHIFYSHFNIKRKKLKKDTCNKCDELQTKMKFSSSSEHDKETLDDHHREAELARKEMNSDFSKAKEQENVESLSYDLEKTFPLPRIPTNIVYYKRQINFYNSGIYSGKDNKGFFYVWMENIASRGAQEVGSCLRKNILNHVGPNVSELNLWSDSCGGQNRNIKIVLLLQTLFQEMPFLEKIRFKYLIPGHSFMPNDSHFGDVESALRFQQRIYCPQDYINIMKSCRKKNKFIVTEINGEDFKSTEVIEKSITNRKKDLHGNKINWLKMKEILLDRSKPMTLLVKTSHDQRESIEIDIKKMKEKGRPSTNDVFLHSRLAPLWPNGKKISVEKKKDIQTMIHLIPKDFHNFYKGFISEEGLQDDIDGYNAAIDFTFD
ncbi:uncharacterized protein LOC111064507 isoform X2 [Nilaparvata lugens]|uniref:uncharacterized protein LOC111064507 isoform X2 n=1 Tax=Nilaparvata lugens TaxID=108931 RepID=UPI00193CD8CA|nr:uncharacterized protein LOC111064507 isoform X2 [Nilaparvata lugens]